MNKKLHIFFAFFCVTISLLAQDKNIIEDLNMPKKDQGNVKVFQDESIQVSIGTYQSATDALKIIDWNTVTDFVMVKGFKVQVFSGNNQQQSKREAEYRRSQVKELYPEAEAVITYKSPMWRLRVGNFQTREEADVMLKELKKSFPTFGREMYIVPDNVKRPIY